MIYRNFNITTVPAIDLQRHNYSRNATDLCNGFYCEIYRVDDDAMANRLDDFTLAEGYEIPKATEECLDRAIIGYVDNNYWRLDSIRNEVAEERKNNLIGRLIAWIGENQKGAQLYDTLSSYMGMTDDEIRQSGFLSLAPYFDKDCYAQSIAEYLIFVGTENTTTGNWHIPFSLVAKNYGVNLATDSEMLDKVCECLYSNGDIVSEFAVGEDEFDMMFFTNYCPYARDDEEVEITQQM